MLTFLFQAFHSIIPHPWCCLWNVLAVCPDTVLSLFSLGISASVSLSQRCVPSTPRQASIYLFGSWGRRILWRGRNYLLGGFEGFSPIKWEQCLPVPTKIPCAAPLRRLSQFKAICAAGSYFRESWSVFRAGMILLVWQIRRRNSCSLLSSATLNPLFLLLQLATVEPGMKFHMYTKEELEEVIKDI